MSSLFGTLETSKLDKADVVDPASATEDGKAADAKKTQEGLDRVLGVASGALALAESKADKLSSRQLEAVNSGIDANKVAKIARNESAISAEVSRATTEEARLQALINAIKTFDAVVADSLPVPSEQYSKKLYLVPSTNPETRNVRDEFICVKIEDSWGWEQVGSTAITIEFDNEPTEGSQKAARSGGIWSWVKSLLPRWLTSDYAEPATVESVAAKADKAIPSAAGNLAAITADGNLKDSGKKASDFLPAKDLGGDAYEVNANTTFKYLYGDALTIDPYNHWFWGARFFYDPSGSSEAITDDANELAVKGDISGLASSKADKTTPSAAGNLAELTADGNLADSMLSPGDFVRTGELDGYLPLTGGVVNGVKIGVIASGYVSMNRVFSFDKPRIDLYEEYNLLESIAGIKWYYGASEDPANEIAVKGDISALQSSKADKAIPSANGNLAALTSDGNLADSGIAKGNVATKNNLEGYLPLTGGTITGSLHVNESLGAGRDLYATFFSTAYNTSWGDVVPALYYSRWYYLPNGSEYPKMSDNEIAVKGDISATNPTFSNAALAVGLNIDTDSVAVLNEIAGTFGGFPIEGTATTVGGLLAALAAAAAWLKKNKVGSFYSVGGAFATIENGVAKLDNFFTGSNGLLTSRVNTLIDDKVGDVNAVLAAALDGTEVA